ncbi:MAG: hypothetical protein PVJ57_12440 [Phycisphaerae bacterium]|jgi:hypothetical protein
MNRRDYVALAAAGARAVIACEPTASTAYVSPRQMSGPGGVFDRYAMHWNRRVREVDAELIFHCCGELNDDTVRRFGSLEPVILSLGSSRRLWEDAVLVPQDVVLFGNLPSRKFFSDDEITAAELTARMQAAGHPFILGSECDILSVRGAHDVILRKVEAMLDAGPGRRGGHTGSA